MKKITLALTALACFGAVNTANAAATASATATWSATAKKDTSSALVVTPLNSLSFDYANGLKAFNTQKGMFDVKIEGDATATNFTLKAQKVTGTLNHLSDASTLEVGVLWNGEALTKNSAVTLIDTTASINGLNLAPLATNFNVAGEQTAQESFTFNIESATSDGTTAVTDLATLPEGIWSGEVKVSFVAEWL
ncbi:common pilus major fimbrillin subunit EcpA [Shewanella algae]|uniref:common pilus major fimbrillin subunit EcpA n=1 Tax=Shewanella algae TaxID=38313 RepID=UPI0011834A60|nr:common pilus major fimbrillin subunit EcpA [Shewanella algae]TVO85966.1 fimbrial protein [Shewanella algae]TXS88180.1 fimbrial protein [Shewanella algae]